MRYILLVAVPKMLLIGTATNKWVFSEYSFSNFDPQWANYRRQADILFFKFFDFMASFNVQTNKKERIFQFSKKKSKIFDF
jgi:hypothetical protein